jgi:hypothetical protein
MEIFM